MSLPAIPLCPACGFSMRPEILDGPGFKKPVPVWACPHDGELKPREPTWGEIVEAL